MGIVKGVVRKSSIQNNQDDIQWGSKTMKQNLQRRCEISLWINMENNGISTVLFDRLRRR